jgi:hypothetical protein
VIKQSREIEEEVRRENNGHVQFILKSLGIFICEKQTVNK